jgi:hypothetical protein
MVMHPQLLFSKQYLTLDLLEGLCSRAKEIAREAQAHNEELSDEQIFAQVLEDMACRSDELRELAGLFAGAKGATQNAMGRSQPLPQGQLLTAAS